MSENKAAFTERTIRSLKNIFYRYMEDYGYKYIHEQSQFVTILSSSKNCSIYLIPTNIKNSDFFSILYSKPLREYRKPNLKNWWKSSHLELWLTLQEGLKATIYTRIFWDCCSFFQKNLQQTQRRVNRMRLYSVNFIRQSWSKPFNNRIVYNRVGFKCIGSIFSDNTLSFLQFFYRSNWIWKVNGRLQIRKPMYQNLTEGTFMFFDKNLSKSTEFHSLDPGLYPSITENVETKNNFIQEWHNHSEKCITVKVSRRMQKIEIYLAKGGSGLACFNTDLGHFFGSKVGNEFVVCLRGNGPHKPDLAYDIVRIHSFMIYTDLIDYKIVGDTTAPLLRRFLFIAKIKAGDLIDMDSTWTMRNLATCNPDATQKIFP